MPENLKYIGGYVTISERMFNDAIDTERAIARHERRMETDPEYAEEWLRGQAERDDWDA